MPPKAKFLKEDIIKTAYEIVRKEGFKGLTARSLASKLHSSPRPLFTTYNSMEEIINDTYQYIYKKYIDFQNEGLKEEIKFKGIGTKYILYAIKEPQLFRELFMTQTNHEIQFKRLLSSSEGYGVVIDLLKNKYNVTEDQAERLYQHLWIYTHGIATMCATGLCVFSMEEISDLLKEEFFGIYDNLKNKTGD